MHPRFWCYYSKSVNMFTKCSSGTLHLYCYTMDKYAKTTSKSVFQYNYQFFFLIIILYNHRPLCDFDMKRDVCNKLIIVVCDFSAVKGFRQKFEQCFCVHACVHIGCLHTADQLTHHWNFTTTCQLFLNVSLNCYIMW